jgi:drug/metabolite transporter (DMT)-like permease
VLLLAQPIATLSFSAVLLAEAPSALQLAGVTLILGGVLLAAVRRGSPPVADGAPEPA